MEIKEIKSKLTLQAVLTHYNLSHDRNDRLCCPWHNDKTPSLQIYPKTNTWTCFSSNCNAGSGDQIDFIMKMEILRRGSCTKHEAIIIAKLMLSGAEVSLIPKEVTKKITEKKQLQPTGSELSRIAVLSKFYRQIEYRTDTVSNRLMVAYVESRSLDRNKISLGYHHARKKSSWKTTSPDWYKSVEKYGLNRFIDCVVFALRNKENQIVGLYGRKITEIADESSKGSPPTGGKHYYLNGTHQGLYPHYPKPDTKTLILTEAVIDAATLVQLDLDIQVLAMYGTTGLTKEHQETLKRLKNLKEIIMFFDGDEAGKKAVEKWMPVLKELHPKMNISYINTPKGEDANSLLQKHEAEFFLHLIDERIPVLMQSRESACPLDRKENGQNKAPEPTAVSKLNTINPDFLVYRCPQLIISILGGIKITGLDKLRVTLKIELTKQTPTTCLPIRESLDLYHGRQVDQLIKRMSEDLQLNHSECMSIISELTNELELYRSDRLELLQTKKSTTTPQMNDVERKAAMSFLKHPDLMSSTSRDIKESGIIGEENNALIGHVIYLSRKRSKPLHVMYLGKSGSGKTYLQEKLAMLIPEEDKKSVTALSDQSLYYLGKQLKYKVLFIEDIEGTENVMYIIRELQTKGWVMKTVVWKDPQGNMVPKDVLAEGPVTISSCTTLEKIYEDNANRCILLYIDDSPEQDKRIMDFQKQLSAGLVKKYEQEQVQTKHQNIQRLLKPINVINPYAMFINLPTEVYRPRRSQQLLLGFIETVTFYHQYQRKVITDKDSGQRYIETTIEDIQISFDLLKEVLFTKSDELTAACRSFLERLKEEVVQGQSFGSKEIRKKLRMHPSKLKRYLYQLQQYGYIKVAGGSRYRGYEYTIVDYEEYQQLKDSIDVRLEAIITQIKGHKKSIIQS